MSINTLINNQVVLAELKTALNLVDEKGVESVSAGAGLAISGSASAPQVDLSSNLLPLADYTIPSLNSADVGKVLSLADASGNMSFISDSFAPYQMPSTAGEEGQILALGSEANQLVWAVDASGGQIEEIEGENGIVATQNATGTSVNLQLDEKLQPLLTYQTMPEYDAENVGKVFKLGAEGAISWETDDAGSDSFAPYQMPPLDAVNVGKLLKQNTADGVCSFVESAGDTDSFAPFSMPDEVVAGDVNKVLKLSDATGLCAWVDDSAGGAVNSVVAGDFISVDNTDATAPVVKLDVGMPSSSGQILSSTDAGVLSWVDDSVGADYYPAPVVPEGEDILSAQDAVVGTTYTIVNAGDTAYSAGGLVITDTNWISLNATATPPVSAGDSIDVQGAYVQQDLSTIDSAIGTPSFYNSPFAGTLTNLQVNQGNLVIITGLGTLTNADWTALGAPTSPASVGQTFTLPTPAPTTLSAYDAVFRDVSFYLALVAGVKASINSANTGVDWTFFGAPSNDAGTAFTITTIPSPTDYSNSAILSLPLNPDIVFDTPTGTIDSQSQTYNIVVPSQTDKLTSVNWICLNDNPEGLADIEFKFGADLPTGTIYFIKSYALTNAVSIYHSVDGGSSGLLGNITGTQLAMLQVTNDPNAPLTLQ